MMHINKISEVLAHLKSEDPVEITIHVSPSVAKWLVDNSCVPHFCPQELAASILSDVRDGDASALAVWAEPK